jgi:hypothetical protein
MTTAQVPDQSKEWLSIPTAMQRSGLARPTLLSRALVGEFEVAPFGGHLCVSAESVDSFLERRRAQRTGEPKKSSTVP